MERIAPSGKSVNESGEIIATYSKANKNVQYVWTLEMSFFNAGR